MHAQKGEDMATLVPCLVALRDEFNALNPDRDKSSDGWIGDAAHADGPSDHNPDGNGNVHAIDVDETLGLDSVSMEDCVQTVLSRCRKNNDDPDNEARLKYIIYERRIWEAPSWSESYYSGSNPHDKHVHFSAESDGKYANDAGPWGIEEKYGELEMDQKTFNSMYLKALQDTAIADRHKTLAGQGVHNQKLGASDETIGQDLQGDDNEEVLAAIAELCAKVDALACE